mmetsp:Transcript_71288/g.125439  ORF Transcript_71288/g.125439 Transcript_71288/m.125439 type:complete len:237 (-) Transcript_71288:15-725(-)
MDFQRPVDSPISIWGDVDAPLRLHDDLSLQCQSWQAALLEEDDVVRAQAKEVFLLEEFFNHGMRRIAGHDVPLNPAPCSMGLLRQLLQPEDTISHQLKNLLTRGQVQVQHPLGQRGAQAGALATRQHHGSNFTSSDQPEPFRPPGSTVIWVIVGGDELRGQGGDVMRITGGSVCSLEVPHGRLEHTSHLLNRHLRRLLHQCALLVGRQLIPVLEHVALPSSDVALLHFCGRHGDPK